jgi:hypothetical protein
MRMAVLETKDLAGANAVDILNIKWEYANKSDDVKIPFQVPSEIAGI